LAFDRILYHYDIDESVSSRWDDEVIRIPCPIHGGDNRTAFLWTYSFGTWVCWSHHCEKYYKRNDSIAFVQAMEKCNFKKALSITAKILKGVKKKDILHRRDLIKKRYEKINHYKQRIIEICDSCYLSNYASKRGISPRVQQKYLIGIYPSFGINRLSIPVFNINSKIVGITARKLIDGDIGPKWMHLPIGFKAAANLYNINFISGNDLIIVEGPFDVLKLETAGIHNSVATFGCHLSPEQLDLIVNEISPTKIYIAYDNDQAGNLGATQAARHLYFAGFPVYRIILDGYNDFGEMPINAIRRKRWQIKKL